MIQHRRLCGVFVTAVTILFVGPVFSHGQTHFTTDLTGYEETPATINSTGSGEFLAKVSKDGTSIQYQLTYRDLDSPVTQAHIHFGRPGLTGGIVLFLCTNLPLPAGVPSPQPCPPFPATIAGTLTAADVIPRPDQGIDAGTTGFAEMVKALRAGAAYANVHTTGHPSGEIRGGLGHVGGDDDDN